MVSFCLYKLDRLGVHVGIFLEILDFNNESIKNNITLY